MVVNQLEVDCGGKDSIYDVVLSPMSFLFNYLSDNCLKHIDSLMFTLTVAYIIYQGGGWIYLTQLCLLQGFWRGRWD